MIKWCWWIVEMIKYQFDEMSSRWKVKFTKCQVDEMPSWQNVVAPERAHSLRKTKNERLRWEVKIWCDSQFFSAKN
jgi:hypothetical protein